MNTFESYSQQTFIDATDGPLRAGARPYEKPMVRRVELAIDETLATGCKLGDDSGCVGPPVTAFEGGS